MNPMTSLTNAMDSLMVPLWESFMRIFYSHLAMHHSHEVGRSYMNVSKRLTLLVSPDSQAIFVETIVYCLFATLVGYIFLRRFTPTLGKAACNRALLLLAGFFPGYLILIPVNRIATLMLPNQWAFPLLLVIYLTVLELALLHYLTARNRSCKQAASIRGLVATTLVAVAMLAFFIIFQMQTGNMYPVHIIGDAATFLLHLMETKHGFGAGEYFPMITRHYDEWLFLYPLVMLQPYASLDSHLEFYWVLYAFGKTAGFAIAILSVAALSGSRLLGVLVACLLFFGSIFPSPRPDHLIFDSTNPLASCLHIARVFLAIMPLMLIALATRYPLFLSRKYTRFDIFLLVLLCIGFSALSINAITLVVFSAAIVLMALYPPRKPAIIFSIALTLCATGALYSSIIRFGEGDARYAIAGIMLFALSIITIAIFGGKSALSPLAATARAYLRREENSNTILIKNGIALGTIFAVSVGFGLLFLGNLFAARFYAALGVTGLEFLPALKVAPPSKFGINPLCNVYPLQFCDSITSFARAYGLPFILIGIAGLFALRRLRVQPCPTRELSLAWAVAIALALLLFSFFAIDFMNGDPFYYTGVTFIWVKTRLAEPWFYSCIALAIVMIWNHSGWYVRPLLIAWLLTWVLLRHALSPSFGIAGQFMINARYLMSHLF